MQFVIDGQGAPRGRPEHVSPLFICDEQYIGCVPLQRDHLQNRDVAHELLAANVDNAVADASIELQDIVISDGNDAVVSILLVGVEGLEDSALGVGVLSGEEIVLELGGLDIHNLGNCDMS